MSDAVSVMSDKKKQTAGFDDAWELLSPRLTPHRRERMEHVAQHRTRHIRLALQDIHDPHNISACMRSAEAMGVMQVDVINLYQKFAKPSSVARGSSQWLELGRFEDMATYLQQTKEAGVKLAAGFPSPDAIPLDQIPVDQPLVIIFGNEHLGVHEDWLPHLDYRFTIPMVGMVESFNISVSAALSMYELTRRARATIGDEQFYLNKAQQVHMLNQWVLRHSRDPMRELNKLRQKLALNSEPS
ncbi:MAG: TrmH family RNA methyltransferase [Oligoflexus sp.]